ncbi:hypothetical protein AVEN_270086-1 [Araneus ventricosus]|uniref:Uncharacterized protein n=1 Tax=Araneus ventricosus TaxID=182803 RepID=A0A4Y2LH33_ARAVE|nr:hypothetical protein AVEN_270086-1 [Araneus ventricosus]
MTRTTPELVPSLSFHATPAGEYLATPWRTTGAMHGGSSVESVSSLEPSGPEAETLLLGHCGRLEWIKANNWKRNNSEIKRKH